jgi:protein-ribulosamine 3-kinase
VELQSKKIMTLPVSLLNDVTELLREKISSTIMVTDYKPATGGCINNGGTLKTSDGDFFIKWNHALKFPGMFEAESKGLIHLRSVGVIDVPEVLAVGASGTMQFILLEYIRQQTRSPKYWETFGEQLAQLHQSTTSHFGLDHDNYIGSLYQSNGASASWIDFFIRRRLQPQLDLARSTNLIEAIVIRKFEKLLTMLPDLLVVEKPSLLHGDLWSGNLITNERGMPCLIDPAVYYGNREVDLAMTRLFGGFNSTYLESYQRIFPLAPGFEERIDLYNLYPLLVHVNLFGGSYGAQVESVVKKFTS